MNQRVRLTKKLLCDAMIRQLEQTSMDKITVVALCNDAGINRTTFYRYYTDPQDLAQSIAQEILSGVKRIMGQIDPNSDVSYLRQMDEVYAYLYENRRSIRLLITNLDFGLQLLESTMLTSGLMGRQARRMDETDRQMAATLLLHGGYSVIRQWLVADDPIPPLEFSRRIRNVLRLVYI